MPVELCKEGTLDKIDLEAFKDSLLGQDLSRNVEKF